MNVLLAEKLTRTYGDRTLFFEVTLGLAKGEKTALVARNGTGKSTLLKILAGDEPGEGGKVVVRDGYSLGYVPQQPPYPPELTVKEALMDPKNPAVQAMEAYQAALVSQNEADLNRAMEAMESAQAWSLEHSLKEISDRLRLPDFSRLMGTLSGGQVKRVALAAVLVQQPDILILDEPTNHLDIDMIEWLEAFLDQPNLTLLMVTHDRYFLDAVCDRIVELDQQKLYTYDGDYGYFLEKKAEREAAQLSEVERAQNIYRRELEWVRRMPKARSTKSKSRLDAFSLIQEKAFSLKKQREFELNSRMKRMGSKILELIKVSKSFGDLKLMDGFTYSFRKGERIGIVGPNGTGKTTLLKMMLGELTPDAGKVTRGETLEIGYYRQEERHLPMDKRVIEVVREVGEIFESDRYAKASAAQMLQLFDFSNEQQYQYIHQLSGGEKKRLSLMLVMLKQPNFLILDEPTNDLDLLTLKKLEDFLENYPGCLVMVSHDRHFMDRLADQLFVFEGKGQVRVFGGSYSEYRAWQEEEKIKEKERQQQLASMAPKSAGSQTAATKEKTKLSYKEKLEFESLPDEISRLEEKKQALTAQLASGNLTHDHLVEVTTALAEVSHQIDAKTDRWLVLSELAES